jgi:hypothetical protein
MHIHRHSTQSSSASIFMHCHCNLLLLSSSASIFMHCHCNLLSRSSSGSGLVHHQHWRQHKSIFFCTHSITCYSSAPHPTMQSGSAKSTSHPRHIHRHLSRLERQACAQSSQAFTRTIISRPKTCTQPMHSHTHTYKQQVTTSQSHNGFI